MGVTLTEELQQGISGDVITDETTLTEYSHDASVFSIKPQVVVFPKNQKDLSFLIDFVTKHKKDYPHLSLTARAASTCMSGGGLSNSIVVSFMKYFNHTPTIKGDLVTTEPGVYYRDFEKETLKHNLIFPPYPSSRELCAMGGIVNNNSGGEKSLQYGKTEDYIKSIRVMLADGKEYELTALSEKELKKKMALKTFEGKIYREIHNLIIENYDVIMSAKPQVSKNSAGYFLWNVYDREKKIFDLTKLFVGAQGTLGFMVDATIRVVPVKKYKEMLVLDLYNLSQLGEIINTILPFSPESLESYDDNTLKLAIKYFGSFGEKLGTRTLLQTAWQFLPEFMMKWLHKLPLLVLQAEFTGDSQEEVTTKIKQLEEQLKKFHPHLFIVPTEEKEKKYWLIRRESFSLLRTKIKNKYSSPFIDDFVVRPEILPEFLPKLQKIFKKYHSLIYTIAGHAGNGNFHIIPLMDIRKKSQQEIIPKLSKEVFDLVLSYHGSTTGEHNDGLIRTPFLAAMYGKHIITLFEKTKQIFDPENIFNPGKKVHGDLSYAMKHIRTTW